MLPVRHDIKIGRDENVLSNYSGGVERAGLRKFGLERKRKGKGRRVHKGAFARERNKYTSADTKIRRRAVVEAKPEFIATLHTPSAQPQV
jgi:hypothetical protein